MQRQYKYFQTRHDGIWSQWWNRLVYIPGAMIIAYGFWLSLTA